jgi:tyrosine-protein phosphatase YwqE
MKKFTIGMIFTLLIFFVGSAFAGDTRPEGLKAQLDTMRLKFVYDLNVCFLMQKKLLVTMNLLFFMC